MIERIFKTYDIRGTYPDMIDEDAAWKIGYATALYFQRTRNFSFAPKVRLNNTICIGRDMRPHSPALAAAVIEGIRAAGSDAIDLGMVDTPFVYFAINHVDCIGGIQVTASHSPIQYNGFRISGAKAKPIGSATGLDDIKRIGSTLRVGKTGLQGNLEQQDLWSAYRHHVLPFLKMQRKLRISVDASNGMAGWMIPAIFDHVPELEIIPVLFETAGAFAHDPNPLVEANLRQLRESVLSSKSDLGVCFDGDADQCVFVDQAGKTIGPDLITALLARDLLQLPQNHGATILYDLRCSRVVAEEITAAGGVAHRARVGHSLIKKTMADTSAIFGGELTGHYYFRENFNADSGAIVFARVLSMLSSQPFPIGDLVTPLQRYVQSGELSFQVDDKDAKIRDLADKFRKGKADYLDGITIDFGDCWFNVRRSNSESVLRLNMECTTQQILDQRLQEVKAMLGEPVA